MFIDKILDNLKSELASYIKKHNVEKFEHRNINMEILQNFIRYFSIFP